jgi:uncharacterized protein YndB with AHSA1/START domain
VAEPQGETSLVEKELRIEAEPELVFSFFTEPEKMVRWMGLAATLDPRPGGSFRLRILPDQLLEGQYREVEPYRRIVFSWGYADFPEPNPLPPGASTVEVELVPDGRATIVRLSHRVPADLADFHTMGWEHYLDRLGVVARGGDPGPDPFVEAAQAMLPARD